MKPKDRIVTINLDTNTISYGNLTYNEQEKAFNLFDEILHDDTRQELKKQVDELDLKLYRTEQDLNEKEYTLEVIEENRLRLRM